MFNAQTTLLGNETLSARYAFLYASQNISCGILICVKNKVGGEITGSLIICILSFILNMILFAAVIARRNLMKQNAVYVYISSTLLANGMYGLFTGCRVVAVYFIPTHSPSVSQFTTFVQSTIVVMFFVFYGNVCFLILALRDNARFMARLSMPDYEPGAHKRLHLMDPKALRKKALVRICLLWCIPLLYVVANQSWNCSELCACDRAHTPVIVTHQFQLNSRTAGVPTCLAKQGFIPARHNQSNFKFMKKISSVAAGFQHLSNMTCSLQFQGEMKYSATTSCPSSCGCMRLWAPLKQGSLVIVYIMWALMTVFMFAMLWHSYVTWPRRGYAHRNTELQDQTIVNQENNSNNRQKTPKSRCCNFPDDRNFWFLVGLATIVLMCTSPSIHLLLVDAMNGAVGLTHILIVIIFLLPVLYTFISTILLLRHIPNLRAAARGIFFCRWVG